MPRLLKLLSILLLLFPVACASLNAPQDTAPAVSLQISAEAGGSLLNRFAPLFIIEEAEESYNRIGTPAFKPDKKGNPLAYIDSSQASIYATRQSFVSSKTNYTNLIYRIHFEHTPYNHLTAGNNVGLLAIITIDANETPLLLTTVHTCGCYLAIIPTTALPQSSYPENWPQGKQRIYGEEIPTLIKIDHPQENKFAIRVRSETHRVMEVKWQKPVEFEKARLMPMHTLRKLPFNGTGLSFFETEGSRKGYVHGSHKPYERFLMGWWAFDWRVGEDKDLGPKDETGTVFYTSLKPWAREKSDLWEFSNFLKYWGWKL